MSKNRILEQGRTMLIGGMFLFILMMMMVGCGKTTAKGNHDSSVGVVAKFMNGISNQDLDTVLECFEPSLRDEITAEFGRDFLTRNLAYLNEEYFANPNVKQWIDIVNYELSGSYVRVLFEDDPIFASSTIEIEGKYYIDDYGVKQLMWKCLIA